MSHFAKVENGVVTKVIVAEQDFIDTLPDRAAWVQTSYNTHGGAHVSGGTPLRKNYAGIGYAYDSVLDAFIPPAPVVDVAVFDVTLDEETCLWVVSKKPE